MDEWQEIERLKGRLRAISDRVSRQSATLTNHPKIRCGDIVADRYAVQERTVESANDEVYTEVEVLPGDPGPQAADLPVEFAVDENGERYILPDAQRTIAVEDQDGTTGKRCEVSLTGAVTVPDGEVARNIVVVENAGNFHSGYPMKSGRVYMGQRNGEAYIASLQGFGDGIDTTITTAFGDVTIEHDTAGHILGTSIVLVPQTVSMMWMYDASGNVWVETVYQNTGPSNRYGSTVFIDRYNRIHILGGIDIATSNVLNDHWVGVILASGSQVTWTQETDCPFYSAYMGCKTDTGVYAWVLGGYDENMVLSTRFWIYTVGGAWTQLADCPSAILQPTMTPGRVLLPYGGGGSYYNGLVIVDPTDTGTPLFYKTSPNSWDTPHLGGSYFPSDLDARTAFPTHGNWSTTTSANSQHVGGLVSGSATKQVFTVYTINGYVLYYQEADLLETAYNSACARGYSANQLFVFGGYIDGVVSNRLFQRSGTQTELTPAGDLPEARRDHACISVSHATGNTIDFYVFGGRP